MHIGIIGGPGHVPNSFALSTDKAFKHCGNTGNLAFRYAVENHIASTKHYFSWHSDPKLVREVCDLIVFPAANQVYSGLDWGGAAKFVEKVDLPCLVVGLGAQATKLDEAINLQKGTIKWLNNIADRSKKIGVRGEYTAEVLAKLGIKNTVVIGCPSYFINSNSNLGAIVQKKLNRYQFPHQSPRNLAITDSAGRPRLKFVEQKLINWMLLHGGVYICQSPKEMIALARKRFDEVNPKFLNRLHRYLLPHASYEEFVIFVKQYFHVFYNIEAWLEFLSSVDLAMGTRIHGNMLAIQSETPCICIHHDSRVNELCNTTLIPNVSVDEFMRARNISELIDIASFDGDVFDKNRAKLALEYKSLLSSNGVEISDSLERMLANFDTREEKTLRISEEATKILQKV